MLFDTQSNMNVGLDIGDTGIKLVELYKKGNVLELGTYAEEMVGTYGGRESGEITKLGEDKLKFAVTDIYKASKAISKNITVGLPMSACQLLHITVPRAAEEILDTVVPIEVRRYMNVPYADLSVSYEKLPPHPHQKDDTINVLVLAAKQSAVEMMHRVVDNLVPEAEVTIEPGIFGTLRATPIDKNNPTLIIDLGATLTSVAFVYDGVLYGVESTMKGVYSITEHIRESMGMTFAEAELTKKEFGILGSSNIPLLRDVAVFAARRVIDEVIHIRSRFETRYTTKCTEVWLTGGGARTKGLQELFAQELGVEVKVSRPFERVEVPESLRQSLIDISPSFSHAIGLAMSRLI